MLAYAKITFLAKISTSIMKSNNQNYLAILLTTTPTASFLAILLTNTHLNKQSNFKRNMKHFMYHPLSL